MTFIQQIDGAIQQGRGAAASVLGQTYTQQRLSSSVSGSITSATPMTSAFAARLRRLTRRVAIENDVFALLAFEATCDNRTLAIGDLLTETGYGSDGGLFTVAQKRPTRETIWMRTESTVTITRARPKGGRASQQPASGAVNASGYLGMVKAGEQVLTLTNGLYAFADSGTPATVPCGLQPLNRIRDGSSNRAAGELPTELYREHFLIYVPLLPGEQLNELDRLNFPNSDRYQIALLFTTETTGLAGYITVCEKLST